MTKSSSGEVIVGWHEPERTPNAYLVESASGDHGWYCSASCASTSPYWAEGMHGPEETPCEGLCCEAEDCAVDDLG